MARDDRRPRRPGRPGKPGRPGRGGKPGRPERAGRPDRPDRPGSSARPARPEPRTDAERRREEVRARIGRRKYGPERPMPRGDRPEARWVDEGAEGAPRPAGRGRQPRTIARITVDDLDARVQREVRGRHGAGRAPRVLAWLAQAAQHFEAHRYAQARSAVLAHMADLEGIGLAHEILGLSAYRLGRWQEAVRHLDLARELRPGDPSVAVVLADCHRALGRHHEVERLWAEVRAASPAPWILAEGRMTMAGSLADRGELAAAIRTMTHGTRDPRRVREHHLREWYVLADLYDRAGEVATARRLYAKILGEDARFADARERLGALGG